MFDCYNFFPWEYTLETKCKRPCKLICAFYSPNEGGAISLENFERSLQQIGGNACTSSHSYLDSRIAGDIQVVNFPGFDWKHNCLFPICHFPELT